MRGTERQDAIVNLINEHGFLSVEFLAQHFTVTPQTIRRDINALDDQGRVLRHHGGAAANGNSTSNLAYAERKIKLLAEKQRIANAIAQRISDHSSLFINIGTTTETIAHALLEKRGLTVITNNLHVASILTAREDFQVMLAGGQVRNRDGGIIGDATVDFVSQFKVDVGIIGISGIDADGELLDFDPQEVKVAQAIIRHSRQVFLAADHSKFGRHALHRMGHLSQASHLFTDRQPTAHFCDILDSHDVRLVVPEH